MRLTCAERAETACFDLQHDSSPEAARRARLDMPRTRLGRLQARTYVVHKSSEAAREACEAAKTLAKSGGQLSARAAKGWQRNRHVKTDGPRRVWEKWEQAGSRRAWIRGMMAPVGHPYQLLAASMAWGTASGGIRRAGTRLANEPSCPCHEGRAGPCKFYRVATAGMIAVV